MKAGLYTAPKQVEMATLPIPTIKKDEVLVKVSYAGICGTDMMIYFGKHPRAKSPLAMGHEFSGVIEKVHPLFVDDFSVGDRVVIEPTLSCGSCDACRSGQYHVCNTLQLIGIDHHGGFAEYVSVPVHCLHKIPMTVTDEQAAVTEPVAVAIHTVRRSSLQIGDTVLILGAGPIGLLIGLAARNAGAGDIIISDISPFRLEKAKELGFHVVDSKTEDVVQVVLSQTNGKGADVVFEVAGHQATIDQMLPAIKFQGKVTVVSVFKNNPQIDLAAMHFRELSLTTTRCYTHDDFKAALRLMEDGRIDVASIVSHVLPIEEIKKGFELMEYPDESLKILFHP
ncbi:alcohol dehydrogenase catalytic domain-containing protein [Terrilactibacillus sp. BCM23-1]|uniref:Alcohol dehydrogenase catalytic domain-containing protein n=2 Tax=Terrilactibacillus tamarindi TaxID=2599694 RepID=A0A6N8CW03_9BACI|nr:alcohol dehydrogenase catalytic domain-containing protein [Terrilactibacillus tamarindi]